MILRFPLYKVQTTALSRAQGRPAFAYFMEMGTGKTLTVLCEFQSLHAEGKVSTLVVVCPNSIKQVWANEAALTGWPWRVHVWPEHRMMPTVDVGLDLVVMNYEAVITMKGGRYLTELLTSRRCMLVLDESINIKNPQARRTKILIAQAQEAGYRRILSGAPMTQGPHDLWAQLRFLGALTKTNFYAFRNYFCRMGGWQGKQIVGSQNETELNKLVGEWAFRARKGDWLDLPKKIYTTRPYELTPQQQKHYKELATDLMTVVGKEVVEVHMVISAMIKMQQVCSGFLLTAAHEAISLPGGNPKLELLREILEETTGKVLIFVMFRHTLVTLIEALGSDCTAWVHGGMKPDELWVQVERFSRFSKCRYMVAQIQSGKYGHTFLGGEGEDRCATTIFYEHNYSLDDRIQAEDRNHRIGQDRPVVYIDLVGPKVEKMIVTALQRKQDVASTVIDGLRHGERI